MIRARDVQTETDSRLFRIVAAEAHSWASLLIEDKSGQVHLFHIGTQTPTEISAEIATSLLQSRIYRAWRGSKTWANLDRLPISAKMNQTAPNRALTYLPETFGDELQSA